MFENFFGIFDELLSSQNVNRARFTRNVECDFLCDFQTCQFLKICEFVKKCENMINLRNSKNMIWFPFSIHQSYAFIHISM